MSCSRSIISKPTKLICSGVRRTDYLNASMVQESFVRRALDAKAANQVPEARLLAFEMPPTYTCGRRERGKLSSSDIELFRAGGRAEFVETRRGGQTTFHGPGQLVVYPIIDLRSFGLSVRCYVSYLEDSIISTLGYYGIEGKKTENTGVWISDQSKIAAIGIHVRRNITSHGMALNVSTDPWWFNRIIACGLPDKNTTTMKKVGVDKGVDEVYEVFKREFGKKFGVEMEEEEGKLGGGSAGCNGGLIDW